MNNVTGLIREVAKICHRWKGYQAITVSLDINTYFDAAIQHGIMQTALEETITSIHSTYSIIKGYDNKTAQLIINDGTRSKTSGFSKRGWQGRVGATSLASRGRARGGVACGVWRVA